ncbi:MAG: ABC transporter permease [Actinobacteria bacterium]|nr:ABC transporter permease [Actinomycetota bacterium]
MSAVRLLWRQTVSEQKMFWRNPSSSGFTIAFPVMFLTIFSLVNGNNDLGVPGVGVVHFASFYLAGIIVMAVLSANFMSLAISLVIRRDEGVLKRKRGTPLPVWVLFAGIVASQTIVSLVMLVITSATSIAFFHVPFPRHVILLVFVVILGSLSFAAIGVASTGLIGNQDAAPAIVNVVSLPVLFLSGVFFPISTTWVRNVSRALPVAPMRNLIFDSFAPPVRDCASVAHCAAPVTHPTGLSWVDLGVLVGWLLLGAVVALATFRWTARGE